MMSENTGSTLATQSHDYPWAVSKA